MTNDYPKVLIIGLSFETNTGSGITLTNQFKGWNPSRLAVVAETIFADESMCANNYQLGYRENKRRFPFNLIQKKNVSGIVHPQPKATISGQVNGKTSFLKKTYLQILEFSGLYYYSRNLRLSKEFEEWVLAFEPDYIYSTANEPEVIHFVKQVQQITQAKIITHIWDDLIKNYFNKPGLFYRYRKEKNNREFTDLLKNTDIGLCISSAMAKEYYERYGIALQVFHNCLDFSSNIYAAGHKLTTGEPFVILYAGRIGIGISDCLIDVCAAIEQLPAGKFEFHIQTTSSHATLDQLRKYPFVKIRPVVPYGEIPGILASADLLLLPYNFDRDSVTSMRLSMPTKIPEYMISGTPILLYAHKEMYLTDFARENDVAYVLTENKTEAIAGAIMFLYSDSELRARMGEIARKYAQEHFDAVKVRATFAGVLRERLEIEPSI